MSKPGGANGAASGPPKPTRLALYSAIVSTVALCGALYNLWYATLRPADIHLRVGNTGKLSFNQQNRPGVLIPVLIWNTGARPAVVTRISAVVEHLPLKRARVFDALRYYRTQGENIEFVQDASSEIVKGGETLRRDIYFQYDPPPSEDYLALIDGKYRLTLRFKLLGEAKERSVAPVGFTFGTFSDRDVRDRYGQTVAAFPFVLDKDSR